MIFNKTELRVELWISRSATEENKFLFDFLLGLKDDIETNFGDSLEWMRLDEKKSCRIQYSCAADGFNKDTWKESVAWHLEHMGRLEQALKKPLQKAAEALKQQNFE